MPPIESKSSKKRWADINAFHADVVKADPSWQGSKPEDLLAAIQGNPDYTILSDEPPSAGFSVGNMISNFPGSFKRNAENMGRGLKELYTQYSPMSPVNRPGSKEQIQSQLSSWQNPQSPVDKITDAVSNTAKEYKDFYLGGNFLKNLEQDPARVAADVATVAFPLGRIAKAAGMAKTASTIGKIGTAADIVSSPIPAVSKAIETIPKISNPIAERAMTYAMKNPPNTELWKSKRGAKFALNEEIPMGPQGRVKAYRAYKKSVREMSRMERDATSAGVDIDANQIKADALGKAPKSSTTDADKFSQHVEDVMADPMHYGGQPVVSPSKAAEVRMNLNESVKPKVGVVDSPEGSLLTQGRNAVLESTREAIGNAIPGHRQMAGRAMDFHDTFEAADRVSRGMRNSSVIDHSNTGAIGASAGHLLSGKVTSPVELGFFAKALHTPELVSKAAIKSYVKDPKAFAASARSIRSPQVQAIGNTFKTAGRKDPSKPFAEDNNEVDPSRPFKE